MFRNPLAIVSLSALVILIVIQVYVINRYYQVKSRDFDLTYTAAVQHIVDLEDYAFYPDTLNEAMNETAFFLMNNNRQPFDSPTVSLIINRFDSLLREFDVNAGLIRNYLMEQALDTAFQYHYIIRDLSLIQYSDTLHVLNTPRNPGQDKPAGLFVKSDEREGNFYTVTYDYFIDFTNKPRILFLEIRGLLTLVIITMLVIIIAFLYTWHFLRKQKMLSEIKDDFIDNISHEFKTPLSVISVGVSSLKKYAGKDGDARVIQTCNILDKQYQALNSMINHVIDVSMLDKGKMSAHRKSLPLKDFLVESVNTFKSGIKARGKNVIIHEEYRIPGTLEYPVEPGQFTRVIHNLLDNAVKHNRQDPVIHIKVTMNTMIKIEIIDNGTGIEPSRINHVFEKFHKHEQGSDDKGLGLGLYIVKRIVENHQGTVSLSSILNEGTTVTIHLPL